MMYRAPRPLPSSGRGAPVSRPPALSVPERPTGLRPGCAAKHYSGTSGKQACLSGTSVFTGLAEIEPTMQLGSQSDVMIATSYVPLSIPDSNSLPFVIRVEACMLRLRQPLARLNLKPGQVLGLPVDSGRRVCVEGGVRFASVANVIDQRGVSPRAYPWQ